MKKLLSSVVIAGIFIGCGGSSSSSSSTTLKEISIKAADAYVVGFANSTYPTTDNADVVYEKVQNGVIYFTAPADLSTDTVEFNIPSTAIVDTDGDGKLSIKDSLIRMPLKTVGDGNIANPLTTAALAKNDLAAFEKVKNFDPVEAKKQLIEKLANGENDPQLETLIALSDATANIIKQAAAKNIDPMEVIKNVNTEIIVQITDDSSEYTEDISQVIQDALTPAAQTAQVDTQEVVQTVQTVLEVIQTAAEAVQDDKVSLDDALTAVIAVSDAGVDAESVTTALENGDIETIIEMVPENETVVQTVEELYPMSEPAQTESSESTDEDTAANSETSSSAETSLTTVTTSSTSQTSSSTEEVDAPAIPDDSAPVIPDDQPPTVPSSEGADVPPAIPES
jgi:hypothetical protein